jgi:hypothetical protein
MKPVLVKNAAVIKFAEISAEHKTIVAREFMVTSTVECRRPEKMAFVHAHIQAILDSSKGISGRLVYVGQNFSTNKGCFSFDLQGDDYFISGALPRSKLVCFNNPGGVSTMEVLKIELTNILNSAFYDLGDYYTILDLELKDNSPKKSKSVVFLRSNCEITSLRYRFTEYPPVKALVENLIFSDRIEGEDFSYVSIDQDFVTKGVKVLESNASSVLAALCNYLAPFKKRCIVKTSTVSFEFEPED